MWLTYIIMAWSLKAWAFVGLMWLGTTQDGFTCLGDRSESHRHNWEGGDTTRKSSGGSWYTATWIYLPFASPPNQKNVERFQGFRWLKNGHVFRFICDEFPFQANWMRYSMTVKHVILRLWWKGCWLGWLKRGARNFLFFSMKWQIWICQLSYESLKS